MAYTIWMDGIKIGETAFEVRIGVNRRAGVFHPTELGIPLLPGITAMGPALLDTGRMLRAQGIDTEAPDPDPALVDSILESPEGRRIRAAASHIARLEVRDASGDPIPWDSLLISDVEEMAAAAASAESERVTRQLDERRIRYLISASFGEAQLAARGC